MKFAKAITKYVRISPSKARRAAGMIRGLNVLEAMIQLSYDKTKGARLLKKTLNSAIANAETQLDADRKQLAVKEIRVDDGPTMKRAKSRSRGGRSPILKRMSHFTVVLEAK